MTAETEAAEMLVRIMGTGINELLRLTGTGARVAGRGAASLAGYIWALKTNGSPKEIARNPGGMAIITIPKESLDDFAAAGKAFPYFRFFTIDDPNYEDGFVDVCLKAEDVATAKRICEKVGIVVPEATQSIEGLSDAEVQVANATDFKQAQEVMKSYVLSSPQAAFDRNTDRDLSRAEPYIICSRTEPLNYVKVMPQKAEFQGQPYTKFTYTCFAGGKQIAVFSDERAEKRPKDFWPKLRQNLIKTAELPENDLVYFKTEAVFERYKALRQAKAVPQIVELDADVAADETMKPYLNELKARLEAAEVAKADPSLPPAKAAAGEAKSPTLRSQKQSETTLDTGTKAHSTATPATMNEDNFYDVREALLRNDRVLPLRQHLENLATHDFRRYQGEDGMEIFAEYLNGQGPKEGDKFYFASADNPDNFVEFVAHTDKAEPAMLHATPTGEAEEYRVFLDVPYGEWDGGKVLGGKNIPFDMATVRIAVDEFGVVAFFDREETLRDYQDLFHREVFSYGEKHFVPCATTDAPESSMSAGQKYSESTETLADESLGLENYDAEDFYKAATQETNLYRCLENGKTYMPFDDGLHEYIPGLEKDKPLEKAKGGVREYIDGYKEAHKEELAAAVKLPEVPPKGGEVSR